MKVGLIDVDGHNFPNLALMKVSAFHKSYGHDVGWYDPMFGGRYNIVYKSKVFSWSDDYPYEINADVVFSGGTGYCITEVNGREVYDTSNESTLPISQEIAYPDYDLYGIGDTAYGFLTRGCPRNCGFCHVSQKEGCRSKPVAQLKNFWSGQKEIKLLDPNLLACEDRSQLIYNLRDIVESKAEIDFTQGLDARLLDEEIIFYVEKMRIKRIHFAWDSPKDKLTPKKLREFSKVKKSNVTVYVLTGYNSTQEEDLERIKDIEDIGFDPYVMIYQKNLHPKGSYLRRLQRWCNAVQIRKSCRFEDYV